MSNNMFDNYDNLSNEYIPNNLSYNYPIKKCPSKLKPCKPSIPFEERNAQGELIGYYWHEGDTVNLRFEINGEITVETNSIILTMENQSPSSSTIGYIGQRAYNVRDLKSWTCTSIENDSYTWTEDEEFIYPELGQRNIYIDASDFLKESIINISLYNFRHERFFEKDFEGNSVVTLEIDECLAKAMPSGVYYCSLTLYNKEKDLSMVLINQGDFTLTVK